MAKISFTLLACFAVVFPSVRASESRFQRLRQFNAGQDAYYAGPGGDIAGAVFNSVECRNPAADAMDNAKIQCTFSGCRVRCNRGYKMGSSSTLFLTCDSATREFTYLGEPWQTSLPPCLPSCDKYGCPEGQACVAPDTCAPAGLSKVSQDCPPGFTGPNCEDFDCDPPCQNGGTCIFVDVCDCPPGYWGLLCEKHRCTVPKKAPDNASFGGDNDLTRLKVECKSGFTMKSGLSSTTFLCSHRQWIIPNQGTIDDIDINCYRA